MIIYAHHIEGGDVKNLVIDASKVEEIQEYLLIVSDHPKLTYTKWSRLFAMDLETGYEFKTPESHRQSAQDAESWVFDPLMRALKVEEFKRQKGQP